MPTWSPEVALRAFQMSHIIAYGFHSLFLVRGLNILAVVITQCLISGLASKFETKPFRIILGISQPTTLNLLVQQERVPIHLIVVVVLKAIEFSSTCYFVGITPILFVQLILNSLFVFGVLQHQIVRVVVSIFFH